MNIIQYWHADDVPGEVRETVATFRIHNPQADHWLFSEASAERFIAEHFSPREVAAFRACAVPAMQADYLRYCAMLALGGVYADVDYLCLRNLESLIGDGGTATFFFDDRQNLPNNFFAVRGPNHPLVRCALGVATVNIERRVPGTVWLVTGPGILSAIHWLHLQCSPYLPARSPRLRDALPAVMETVRIHAAHLLVDMMAGVRLLPTAVRDSYVRPSPLPHQSTAVHWSNWEGSIYR